MLLFKKLSSKYILTVALLITSVMMSGCLVVHQKLPGTLKEVSGSPLAGIWVLDESSVDDKELDPESKIMTFAPSMTQKDCLLMVQGKRAYHQKEMSEKYNTEQNSGKNVVLCTNPVEYKGQYYLLLSLQNAEEDLEQPAYFVFKVKFSPNKEKLTLSSINESKLKDLLLSKTKYKESDFTLDNPGHSLDLNDVNQDSKGLMKVLQMVSTDKPTTYTRSKYQPEYE
jgi:hypothetical protein